MARQVLPIVGAAIDIYFGGNGQVGYIIGERKGSEMEPSFLPTPKVEDSNEPA